MRMCFRKQSYFVCDHSTPNVGMSMRSKRKMISNIPNYIWNVKRVIGSSSLVEDEKKEVEEGKLKENLELDSERGLYNVEFDNKHLKVDAEHAMAFMLEYGYYIAAKKHDDSRSLSEIAKSVGSDGSRMIITVRTLQ